MLRTLRKLFDPETAPPQMGGGKLTLRDVLLCGWDELWYQPKIELRTKRLVGAEGLLRARRPDGSIVPPGDFLPGAKEEEMLALTERVIVTALRDFEDCAVHGASVKLSVNVPVSALVKLPLARMLREHRPPTPNWPGLILELSESVLMADGQPAAQVLQELRGRGFRLALDDFGAGYSSLGRLRDFSVDILKMDQSFVAGIGNGLTDGAILRAIIGIANTLGLMTIADGVERPEQLAALNAMGCHAGQGVYLSQTVDFEGMEALLASCIQSGSGRQLPPTWRQTA